MKNQIKISDFNTEEEIINNILSAEDIISQNLYSVDVIRRKKDKKLFGCVERIDKVLINEVCEPSCFINENDEGEELILKGVDTSIYDVIEILYIPNEIIISEEILNFIHDNKYIEDDFKHLKTNTKHFTKKTNNKTHRIIIDNNKIRLFAFLKGNKMNILYDTGMVTIKDVNELELLINILQQ